MMKTIRNFFKAPYIYLIIIVIGLLLKIYGLESKFFWLDEIYTIYHTSGIKTNDYLEQFPADEIVNINEYHHILNLNNGNFAIGDQLKGLSKMPQFTPLHYVFLVFWNRIIGASYLDYRLFSLLMFFITLILLFYLAKQLFKSNLPALITTAFFSVSPYLHIYTQEARYYIFWFMCIVLINLILLKALERKKIIWWIGYTLVALVSLYASTLSGLILAGHLIYVWLTSKNQRIQHIFSLLIVLIAYIPWLFALKNSSDEIASSIGWQVQSISIWKTLIGPWLGLAQVFSHTQGYWDYWGSMVVGSELPDRMYYAIVIHILLLVLIITAIVFFIRKLESDTKWFLLLSFLPGIIFFYLLDLTGRWTTFAWRYHIVNFAGILLIVSYFFNQKIASGKIRFSILFLSVITLGIFSSFNISKDKCFSSFGSCYGKVMAAELFSNDIKPLIVSDAAGDLGLMGLLETIIECNSDNIDIYYTSNPKSLDSIARENNYSNIYLYQASGGLKDAVRKQLVVSEFKNKLPPVILTDKYIEACLEKTNNALTEDYLLDISILNIDTCRVSFIVSPGIMPDSSIVYITGSHDLLGYWNPNLIPLKKGSDGKWIGTFTFEKEVSIEYKFTRGSWESEFVDKKGNVMPNYRLNIKKDTTITIIVDNWKDIAINKH